jgi:queuine tRNA-ribosyltransferase
LPSIQRCVTHGVDTFDSAFPTRNGRHGKLFTSHSSLPNPASASAAGSGASSGSASASGLPKAINIRNSKWANYHEPISPYLPYSGAYLHHLFKAKEPLAALLCSQHNLCFMQDFMAGLRRAILDGSM